MRNFRRASCPTKIRKRDRKSTRLNSSHGSISYAVFCLKKETTTVRLGDDLAHVVLRHALPAVLEADPVRGASALIPRSGKRRRLWSRAVDAAAVAFLSM